MGEVERAWRAPWGSHRIVKDGTHWDADHSDALSSVSPLWCSREGMIQNRQHVLIVPDLLMAGRIFVVWAFHGDLIPHLAEVHVDARVVLDKVLELLHDGDEILGVVVDVLYLTPQPFVMDSTVSREPVSMAVDFVLLGDAMLVPVLPDHNCVLSLLCSGYIR